MSTILVDPERRTVPRWRPWREAVRLGDLDAATERRVPQDPNPRDLKRLKVAWEISRALPFAGDFVGAAFASGEPAIARDAARFLLSSRSVVSKAARDLAELILGEKAAGPSPLTDPLPVTPEERHKRIHDLRSSLREFPRNPLAYMDLAREYVSLGQPNAALKPVEIALRLAPGSRFVLRSAARFFLHFDDRERAHYILRRAGPVKTDPWLLAAEIAVASAAGRTSSLIKTGRQILASQDFPPVHISELASAIGTLEWKAGNRRLFRRLFRQALQNPTENTVAQAGWISRRIGDVGLDPRVFDTPRSYEARAWADIGEGKWIESVAAAELWLRDEPFASRPAAFGSWAAQVTLSDFETAARFARHGLLTHPYDFTLLNNLAVSLANLGQITEALENFERIDPASAQALDRPTYLATKGLIQFRLGLPEEGRRLYRAAISEANSTKDTQAAVWALLHFAREEFRCDPSRAQELIREALAGVPKLPKVDQLVSARLLEQVLQSSQRREALRLTSEST